MFTGIDRFRPAGAGGELKLFELAGIKLVHGWLVDPDSQEYKALSQTEDYDTSLDAVVAADILTSGQLVESEETDITVTAPKSPLSEEDHQKVVDGELLQTDDPLFSLPSSSAAYTTMARQQLYATNLLRTFCIE